MFWKIFRPKNRDRIPVMKFLNKFHKKHAHERNFLNMDIKKPPKQSAPEVKFQVLSLFDDNLHRFCK